MEAKAAETVASLVRNVSDFPREGINFKDITPLLADAQGLKVTIDAMAAHYADTKVDFVAGMEARGFIVGTPLAIQLGCGFIMLRKPSKLPGKKISVDFGKEYGKDVLEIAEGVIKEGQKVLIVDDLLATGGTAAAACQLIEKAGGVVVSCGFIIELGGLPGRNLLEQQGKNVWCLLTVNDSKE